MTTSTPTTPIMTPTITPTTMSTTTPTSRLTITPDQKPVTIPTQGCSNTGPCSSVNGVCVSQDERVPEGMTEITGLCDPACKCVAPGEEPVTFTTPGQEPVTLTSTSQEPVTLTTTGQEPVTLTTAGCTQTAMCVSSNGLCVGEHEAIPEWLAENRGYCTSGCKCVSPGQEPVTFSIDGQEPVTLSNISQESHNTTSYSDSNTSEMTLAELGLFE